MQRVVLNIKDEVYEHIIYLLKHLEKDAVEIISEEKFDIQKKGLKSKLKNLLDKNDIKPFEVIKDPVEWQRKQRSEWDQDFFRH